MEYWAARSPSKKFMSGRPDRGLGSPVGFRLDGLHLLILKERGPGGPELGCPHPCLSTRLSRAPSHRPFVLNTLASLS